MSTTGSRASGVILTWRARLNARRDASAQRRSTATAGDACTCRCGCYAVTVKH